MFLCRRYCVRIIAQTQFLVTLKPMLYNKGFDMTLDFSHFNRAGAARVTPRSSAFFWSLM